MHRQNYIFSKLLAASLGILISSVSLEVALRLRKGELFSTENQILKKARSRPNPCLSRLDSHLGWRTEANQSSSVPSKRDLNKKSYVSSNHFGLRNNNQNPPRWKEKKGFLALGDSFTFGDEVSDWETWPAQLEQLTGLRIFNAGACTYGLDQAYLRFQELVSQLPLQGVIIEITPDSIERTSRKGMLTSFFKKHITKPYYLLENGSLIGKSQQLSVLRRFLGYSYLFDFVFRKTALHWWWGIVDKRDYPKEFQTEESAEQTSCEILKEWRTKLASSKLLGIAVI
ncbi:MAG: hypothetical protein EBZ49_02310 [Proteobacteria bacterium]|nr:hypothetical protein [Pseudomonadota bacterium]